MAIIRIRKCLNCHRWGHTSHSCRGKAICSKCADSHEGDVMSRAPASVSESDRRGRCDLISSAVDMDSREIESDFPPAGREILPSQMETDSLQSLIDKTYITKTQPIFDTVIKDLLLIMDANSNVNNLRDEMREYLFGIYSSFASSMRK